LWIFCHEKSGAINRSPLTVTIRHVRGKAENNPGHPGAHYLSQRGKRLYRGPFAAAGQDRRADHHRRPSLRRAGGLNSLSLSGLWVKDPRHGWQFQVEQYALERPNTLNGIERYLGSGLIRGVGPRFAARIVKQFGLATLDILEKEPDRLDEVHGLGRKRISRIKETWQGQKNIHRIMIFLQGQGISVTFAVKIFKTYGADALQIVRTNPYRLTEDIWGIGFKSADRIALSMGIAQQDPRRARAGLLFALGEAANDGHC
jgi:exodeoxyribonuclease V alpha subunit